jgi:RNA polymerase sigma-70 factor (ECF subfamily)
LKDIAVTWLRPIDSWFADTVHVHQAVHRRYAHRLTGSAEEGEELVQEAYARLFALSDWAGIGNPHAFTMRIIHNLAVERFRRAEVVHLDRGIALQSLDPADDAPRPDQIAAAREELRRVSHALDALPERCREAVHLRRIEGLPPREVAERMGIAVSTVEKHLVKGLRLLVERLALPDDSGAATQDTAWTRTARHDNN